MEYQRRRQFFSFFLLLAIIVIVTAGVVLLANSNWLKKSAKLAEQSQPGLYRVVSVADGDTITVDMNGTDEEVRFIGVDTPETHDPRKPVQCYGPEASAFTKSLLTGQKVRLQADPLDTNRDRYNRLLRYIYLPDGTFVESKLLMGGYALAYTAFPFERKADFVNYENEAKQANKGLWSMCQIITEPNGARHTNPVQ